jgi:hypothetical protein
MPQGLGIALFQGRLRPRLAHHEVVALDVQTEEVGSEDAWTNATAVLSRWLQEKGVRDIPIRFVVSTSYTRFALLPWLGAFAHGNEIMTLMLARFSEQYGDMKAWSMSLDQAISYGLPTLAFAMPTALITYLIDTCKQYGLVCRDIQPYMATSWNQWKHAVARFPALYAVAEGNTVVMAIIQSVESESVSVTTPHWSAIRAMKLPSTDLANVLNRELLLNGLNDQASIFLDAPDSILSTPLSNVTHLTRHASPNGIAGMAAAGANW